MRILNICAYTWAIGGPARIIYDHAGVAVQRGHQVDILSPMSPGDDLYPAPEGVRVIPVLRTLPISRVFREYSAPLYQYLKAHIHEYDIVHCHGIWHFGSLAPFLLDKSVKKVITIHGLLDKWAIRHNYWKKKLLTIMNRAIYSATWAISTPAWSLFQTVFPWPISRRYPRRVRSGNSTKFRPPNR